jgi:hypothetical protein
MKPFSPPMDGRCTFRVLGPVWSEDTLMNATFYLPMMLSLGTVYFALAVTLRSRLARDPVPAVMFGAAVVLTFALLFSAAIAARTQNFDILKIVVLAAGVFSILGIVLGLVRSLRAKHTA